MTTHGMSFHIDQAIKSILLFLFHTDYLQFLQFAVKDRKITVISLVLGYLFFYRLLISITENEINKISYGWPIGWMIVIFISLAGPTFILESSNNIFGPGIRSPMLSQAWQPLLYVSVIFYMAKMLTKNYEKYKQLLLLSLPVLLSVIFTIALDYNYNLPHIEKNVITK